MPTNRVTVFSSQINEQNKSGTSNRKRKKKFLIINSKARWCREYTKRKAEAMLLRKAHTPKQVQHT